MGVHDFIRKELGESGWAGQRETVRVAQAILAPHPGVCSDGKHEFAVLQELQGAPAQEVNRAPSHIGTCA
jgi:hypothetical protein